MTDYDCGATRKGSRPNNFEQCPLKKEIFIIAGFNGESIVTKSAIHSQSQATAVCRIVGKTTKKWQKYRLGLVKKVLTTVLGQQIF